jgi:hypothetical protein
MIRFTSDHPLFTDNFVVGGTGSRYFRAQGDPALLKVSIGEVKRLQEREAADRSFIIMSGGAHGWDRYLIKIAAKMGLPYVLVIPSPEFPDYYWGKRGSPDHKDHTKEWQDLAEKAVEVMYVNSSFIGRNGKPGGSNFDRNDAMVKVADYFLVWNVGTSGTQHCVAQLLLAKVPFTNMVEEYQKICSSTA